MTLKLFVGTYTFTSKNQPPRDAGIFIFEFDPDTETLKQIASAPAGNNPSFLAIHPNKKYLYAVNELREGTVRAFRRSNGTEKPLELINLQATSGSAPCYVSCDPGGSWLLVSNYGNGSIAVFPINPDGSLEPHSDTVQHEGGGPDQSRQEGPHAHSIITDPGGNFILAADLGLDQVLIYKLDTNGGKLRAKLRPNDQPGLSISPGSGPRHMAFHPNEEYFYVANEMGNSVTACSWDSTSGFLDAFQTLPTLPVDFTGENTVADIHISPSGGFLYVSNRGDHSLAVFRIEKDGSLDPKGHVPSGGQWPRNFTITPSGSHLIAANEHSDNLVVFRLDAQTGIPIPTGVVAEVPKPVCVIPVEE